MIFSRELPIDYFERCRKSVFTQIDYFGDKEKNDESTRTPVKVETTYG